MGAIKLPKNTINFFKNNQNKIFKSGNLSEGPWNEKLSEKQLKYAASDVIHLHALKKELNKMLIREKRDFLFQECLKFLNTRVDLDLADYKNDIFSH